MLSFIFNLNAQMYSYYNGYVSGYQKACECNVKIEKSNDLLYNNGTWNEGYSAGFVDGRLYRNKSTKDEDKQPLYQPDYNQINQSLEQKQNLLNKRRQIIQNEYYAIQDLYIAIVENRNPKFVTQSEKEYFEKLKETTSKYGNYDLSNTDTFNQIINWFREEKIKVSKW